MKRKGNTIYFSLAEKKIIKNLIDRKYNKITTPVDYDTNSDNPTVETDVRQTTGKNVSGSTLERLVGLRENKGVSVNTIEIVSEYLDFRNLDSFLQYIEFYQKRKNKSEKHFSINDIISPHLIRISFTNEKLLVLSFLQDSTFSVESVLNLLLEPTDKLEILQLHIGDELICDKVTRYSNGRIIGLGKYKTGENNKIQKIELLKNSREQHEL